jgi:pimeloyl-ACP methyl ester carboxylesterase
VLETMDARGVERATVMGHSLGGRLVLELAAIAPERVERAVLLDPAIQILPHVALDSAEDARRERAFDSLAAAVDDRLEGERYTPRSFVEADYAQHFVEGPDGKWRPRHSAAAAVTLYSEMAAPPPSPSTLQAPTLLLYAPAYGLVREDQVAAYSDALGDRLSVVEVSGRHMVMWDAYDETASALVAFLRG